MKSFYVKACFIGLIACLTACGPIPPSEEELRNQIVGVYCTDMYRLELSDSTYMNRKIMQSPLRSGLVRESCSGMYFLVFENESWILRFQKDENPRSVFQDCEREYVLWSKEEEYLFDQENITLKDLFDGKELQKGACDD